MESEEILFKKKKKKKKPTPSYLGVDGKGRLPALGGDDLDESKGVADVGDALNESNGILEVRLRRTKGGCFG